MKNNVSIFALLAAATLSVNVSAQYTGWSYSDSLFILTTPEGANLPASASETGFPLLVRLNRDFFTFSQVQASGADIRFSTPTGTDLPYQIEEWDATNGTASIWVRVPTITGNSRQAIVMHWGNSGAPAASNGAAVFSSSNGFVSVLHMNDQLKDEAGTLTPNNSGTTVAAGMIGKGRHFTSGQNISQSNVSGYPTGNSAYSTSLWFNSDSVANTLVNWGKFTGAGFMRLFIGAYPPVLAVDGMFAPNCIYGKRQIYPHQWYFVEHTYEAGETRMYLNGVLDSSIKSSGTMALASAVDVLIGGYLYGSNNFPGVMDEVRVSRVARSANWTKLEYENQKPGQTLAGLLVPAGSTFTVSQTQLTVPEGQSVTIPVTAGGAQKIYWTLTDGGQSSVIAVDRLDFVFAAGRVTGDKNVTLQCSAVYLNEVKTRDIAVTIKEDIPEPVFMLAAPAAWNGRDSIVFTPQITNLTAMQARGAGTLHYSWNVSNVAVVKTVSRDSSSLVLRRAQGNGTLIVTLSIENGGAAVTRSVSIQVQQPVTDAWVARTPDANEKPVDSQFYARDDRNGCTVYYKGTLTAGASPDSVYLDVYAGATLSKRLVQKPAAGVYSFEPVITPGLTEYKFVCGTMTGSTGTVLNTVNNVVCGDAYLIDGQSNAESTQFGTDDNPATSEWIRTWGSMGGSAGNGWSRAVHVGSSGKGQIGYWGLELARNLVAKYSMPICIMNGAVGGTLIEAHQRNDTNPADSSTIYGRLLRRVRGAKLTNGIRGALWHQGENNGGRYAGYRQYFIDMSAGWKKDYPNILNYYIFQVYPLPCGMGSDDGVREAQRTLPFGYSNMSIMSSVGFVPAGRGTCHFSTAGYMQFVRYMSPLVERDNYGLVPAADITVPNLLKAYYSTAAKDEIALVFTQNVVWNSASTVNFFFDPELAAGKVTSGSASGKVVRIRLNGASAAKTISYVVGKNWNGDAANLLKGTNGIAALTFADVPIMPDSTTAVRTQPVRKVLCDVTVAMKNGAVYISFGRPASAPTTVELVNLRGQTVVSRKTARAEAGNGQMTMTGLRRGVYILKVKSMGSRDLLKKLTVY